MNMMKIVRWVLLALVSVIFLAAGIMCVMGKLAPNFHDWGYPAWSPLVIGAIEIFAALGLYYHKTAGLALMMLMVICLCSILTLAGHHDWKHAEPLIPAFSLLAVWGLMYLKNKREDEDPRWGLL